VEKFRTINSAPPNSTFKWGLQVPIVIESAALAEKKAAVDFHCSFFFSARATIPHEKKFKKLNQII